MLSEIIGEELKVFSMNSAMDTTDLLGGFEQVSLTKSQYPRSLNISLHSIISKFARKRQSLKSKCSQIREFVYKLLQTIDRSYLLFSRVVLSRLM